MTLFEFVSVVIASFALLVSAWNYKKINDINSKEDYKSKNQLVSEVLSEVKALIQKVISETDTINTKRLQLITGDSPYSKSFGAGQGHEAILKEIKAMQTIKGALEEKCEEIMGLSELGSKQSFDSCLKIKNELLAIEQAIVKHQGKAQQTIDNMLHMAAQSNA